MTLDPIAFFNQPFPGSPDPQITRLIIVAFVMAVAFGWTKNMVRRWTVWDRETKRTTQWLTALLVTNGLLLLTAAQRDDPIRVATAALGVVFIGLTLSIFVTHRNDGSTDPVYPYLYPSALLRRFR